MTAWPLVDTHLQTALPSTYSITIHRCLLVSKEQNMETTKGFSANVRMSRSTKACWIWFLRIRFCLLIFFMAKRCRVSLCRTRKTALRKQKGFQRRAEREASPRGWEPLSPVGAVADEFDVLKVLLPGGLGPARGRRRGNRRSSALKHNQLAHAQTLSGAGSASALTSTESSVSGVSGLPLS